MGATILLRDVIREAKNRFLIAVRPLHRQLDGNVAGLGAEADRVGVQGGLELGEMFDEGADSAFVLEHIFFSNPLILNGYFYTRIQESQLAQALGQDFILEIDMGESTRAGQEPHRDPAAIRGAYLAQRIQWFAQAIFLPIFPVVAINREPQVLG